MACAGVFSHVVKAAAAKRAAAKALVAAAKGKAPKGLALVDFREPTAAERRRAVELVDSPTVPRPEW